jgi:hypothetical protein
MATTSRADIILTPAWQDIAATDTGLASVDIAIQNNSDGPSPIYVVFGGASAPTETGGVLLERKQVITGNAANVWVRASLAGKITPTIL